MYFLLISVTILNTILIIKSIYYNNLFFFIFYSIWMILYTFQIYFIYSDLEIANSVHYLHVDINRMGFDIALILYTIFILINLFIPQKIVYMPKSLKIIKNTKSIKIGKYIYVILYVLLIFSLLNKVGGLENLITLSRPGFISGVPIILFLIMSTKIYFILNYIKRGKIDKTLLFLFILTLIMFAISSRLMLLTSILFILLFLWTDTLKKKNINKFKYYIYYTPLPPILFLLLGILKWGNSSIDVIRENGLLQYFQEQFSDIYTFLIVNIYTLSIESFSILSSFLSKNGLDFKPNFMLSDLDFFTYILPSFLKELLREYTVFINSFSNVEGAVPVTIATLTESFHILGIVVFFLIIYLLSYILKKMLLTVNIYKYIIFLIILSNSFLFIRGNIKVYLLYTIVDIFGVAIYYYLNKLVIKKGIK